MVFYRKSNILIGKFLKLQEKNKMKYEGYNKHKKTFVLYFFKMLINYMVQNYATMIHYIFFHQQTTNLIWNMDIYFFYIWTLDSGIYTSNWVYRTNNCMKWIQWFPYHKLKCNWRNQILFFIHQYHAPRYTTL